jgi:hypothetical protein
MRAQCAGLVKQNPELFGKNRKPMQVLLGISTSGEEEPEMKIMSSSFQHARTGAQLHNPSRRSLLGTAAGFGALLTGAGKVEFALAEVAGR